MAAVSHKWLYTFISIGIDKRKTSLPQCYQPHFRFCSHVLLVATGLGSSDRELSMVTGSSAEHTVKFDQNEKEQVAKAPLFPLGRLDLWGCKCVLVEGVA